MASFCRSSVTACFRSMAARSKTPAQKTLNPKPVSSAFSSSRTRITKSPSRVFRVLGSVESLMPFHSATANARLKSNIAVDSSCWSWLSQDFAVPR
ncbi:hypothetical protein K2173_013551 [Erythroxylum novogranatense]|uniref:Protein NUCLEAR FUSION DEFECTIVE 6, chloroplastic/mitochondrial-like n=1 Tax=Erythroxylum novogranatense TaxID=1862640 RepID=A0AAV8TLY4_9ROSI|nr:hypothetical protein K2173_013551 [Erythroxylum novogranatense]